MTGLAPLTRSSFREQALREIRARIIVGDIEAGQIYSARSLAAQLGVSVTPVREALLDLVNEGLVEAIPNRGFRITELTEADLDEIFELRLLLEVPAVGALAGHLSPREMDELRAYVERGIASADAGDLADFLDADRSFHLRILELHGNQRLVRLVDQLRLQTRLYGLPHLLEQGVLVASAQEHAALLNAISAASQEDAETLMRRHLRHTRGVWAGLRESPEGSEAGAEQLEGEGAG